MGREVGRISEELGEGKNVIRIHFIKIIFFNKKKRRKHGRRKQKTLFMCVTLIRGI